MDTGSVRSRPTIAPRSQVLREVAIRETIEVTAPRPAAETTDRESRPGHRQPLDRSPQQVRLDPESGQTLLQAAVHTGDDRGMPNQALIRERAYRSRAEPHKTDDPSGRHAPHADVKA